MKGGEIILGKRSGFGAGNSGDNSQSKGSRGKTQNSARSSDNGLSWALNARKRSLDGIQ